MPSWIFVDDIVSIVRQCRLELSQEIVDWILKASGLRESEEKRETGKRLVILGLLYDFSKIASDGYVTVEIPEDKKVNRARGAAVRPLPVGGGLSQKRTGKRARRRTRKPVSGRKRGNSDV